MRGTLEGGLGARAGPLLPLVDVAPRIENSPEAFALRPGFFLSGEPPRKSQLVTKPPAADMRLIAERFGRPSSTNMKGFFCSAPLADLPRCNARRLARQERLVSFQGCTGHGMRSPRRAYLGLDLPAQVAGERARQSVEDERGRPANGP